MEAPITDLSNHISVSMSSSYGDDWKNLRCIICGNVVCQYNNDFIRTITPSGEPVLDAPGKKIQCQGVLQMYKPKDVMGMLYDLFEVIQAGDIAVVQSKVIELAQENQKISKMCKARYYVG